MAKGRRTSAARDSDPGGASTSKAGNTLSLKHTCSGHTQAVSAVRFSPDGQLLASVSADRTLKVWKVPEGTLVEPSSSGTDGAAEPSSSSGPTRAEQPKQQQQPEQQHAGGINDVAWNCNSRYLATASDDLTAKIWDVETRKCLATYEGHTNYVFCCQFNPQGTMLVTGSYDETIRFWDVRSGRCLRELPAHSDPITGMDYHPDGTVLASCSFDGLLRLWDVSTGHCLITRAVQNAEHPLSSVHFSPTGKYMLVSALDSTMRLVGTEQGEVARVYRGHTNKLYCSSNTFFMTLPKQQAVASGSEDGSIYLWDLNSKQVLQHIPPSKGGDTPGPGHSGAVLCVAAHPTRPLLASAGRDPDNTVKLWSAEGGK